MEPAASFELYYTPLSYAILALSQEDVTSKYQHIHTLNKKNFDTLASTGDGEPLKLSFSNEGAICRDKRHWIARSVGGVVKDYFCQFSTYDERIANLSVFADFTATFYSKYKHQNESESSSMIQKVNAAIKGLLELKEAHYQGTEQANTIDTATERLARCVECIQLKTILNQSLYSHIPPSYQINIGDKIK